MSIKRSAQDEESCFDVNGNRRYATPISSPLQRRVTALLKIIHDMQPTNLIILGLDIILNDLIDGDRPSNTLHTIDAQITTLTEATETGKIEAKYVTLTELMIERLNNLNKELLYPPSLPHKAMPTPSDFGKRWVEAQEGPDAILCLRPPHRQGLPLITLHEAFLFFVNESKKSLLATEADALRVASQLSRVMAESYETEQERRDVFNRTLHPFIPKEKWLPELILGEKPGMTGRLDGALIDYPLLREDNVELDSNGDPYMQLARGFQTFVMWKKSQDSDHGKPGVAKFLLIVSGPYLTIAGGFYDGESTIVEPLTPTISMLPDCNIEGRPMALAQCLLALKKAIDRIPVPPERAVVAATPCIYSSIVSSDDTEIPISFVEPLPILGSLIFLATAMIESTADFCLVKLVYGHYGAEVHRLLADDDLAPGLLGVRIKEGAPTAIAMEYLKPHSRGSEGWVTLHSFAQEARAPDVQKSLAIAVHEIVRKLEQANLVHGDLRENNLMVHVNANGTVLDGEKVRLKAIDFDWGGKTGKPTYPLWRNVDIPWPAEIGEAIIVGHDQALVKSWWGKLFPQQAYPPVV